MAHDSTFASLPEGTTFQWADRVGPEFATYRKGADRAYRQVINGRDGSVLHHVLPSNLDTPVMVP